MKLDELKKEYHQAIHELRPQDWWLNTFWPEFEKLLEKEREAGRQEERVVPQAFGGMFADIRKLRQEQDEKLKQQTISKCIEVIEGGKVKHYIDAELFENTGGGEMCEICGAQGKDLINECKNEINKALDQAISNLKE